MLKKTITYKDYDGVERKEDFYFNMSKAEILEMQMSTEGGLRKLYEKIIQAQDVPKIVYHFKKLILDAYGEKSADGKRFIKSKELSEAFSQTEAYSNLYIELATDAKAATDFMNELFPSQVIDEIAQKFEENNNEVATKAPSLLPSNPE